MREFPGCYFLIGAEVLVLKRMRLKAVQFTDRNIITENLFPRFKEIIASAMKLRNSVFAELILIIIVFSAGYFVWSWISGIETRGSGAESWYTTATGVGNKLTLAGYWYLFVSRTVYQFIILR
ncbi:MAG: hypothetical protein L0Y76_03225 [Ignavibacteria bacterium]|nr:hypothetical protein [Ignavibacteria bacterium]